MDPRSRWTCGLLAPGVSSADAGSEIIGMRPHSNQGGAAGNGMRVVTLRNARGTGARIADGGATLVELTHEDSAGTVHLVLGPPDVERDLRTFPAAAATVGR